MIQNLKMSDRVLLVRFPNCPECSRSKWLGNLTSCSVTELVFEGPSRELEIFVEDEVLDESDDHLLLGEIPEHTLSKLERLGTSSSPPSSMVKENTSPLLHRTCSGQRASPLVGSSTSAAIS